MVLVVAAVAPPPPVLPVLFVVEAAADGVEGNTALPEAATALSSRRVGTNDLALALRRAGVAAAEVGAAASA